MNRIDRCIAALACAAWSALAMPGIAAAHEGHDDDKPAAAAVATPRAAASGTATPVRGAASAGARFAATSDQFELVGVLDGRVATLYLDRFADNVPIENARIELEIGTEKLVAKAQGDIYRVELSAPPAAGTTPVTVTVVADGTTDLLAAGLETPVAPASVEQPPRPPARTGLLGPAGGAALAVAVAAGAIGWAAGRRRGRT